MLYSDSSTVGCDYCRSCQQLCCTVFLQLLFAITVGVVNNCFLQWFLNCWLRRLLELSAIYRGSPHFDFDILIFKETESLEYIFFVLKLIEGDLTLTVYFEE